MGMQSTSLSGVKAGASSGGGLARLGVYTVILLVLIGIAYGAYWRLRPIERVVSRSSTVPASTGTVKGVISGTGQVAASTYDNLSYLSTGVVATVNVHIGDSVKKDDVLGTLDPRPFDIAVAQQKANVAAAQARLAAIQAGPRQEDVDVANAALGVAQAKLASMLAQGRPENVKAAEATLASATAKLHELQQGAVSADIVAAKTAVDQAKSTLAQRQDDLAKLTRPPDPIDVKNAQLAVETAKNALYGAQTSRDGICGPSSTSYACNSANANVASAQTAITQAQLKLDQLNQGPRAEELDAAKAAVASAQAQLTGSEAKLAQLQSGSLPDDIAQASATVDQATQTLALQKTPFTDDDVAQQRLVIAQLTAQLALKKAPYTQADIDAAKAAVDLAQSQLDLAIFNRDNATIKAPFGGIIGSIGAYPGEVATSLPAIVAFQVVDPNDLELGLDVDENDVTHVKVGQGATMTFDALPSRTFNGKVISIPPNASVTSGVTAYRVKLSIPNAEGVKPGMTGRAEIVYEQHDNVLVVPSRAVRNDGEKQVVGILDGTKTVPRPVTIGMTENGLTEISSGLKAGELVVVPSTAELVSSGLNDNQR
jgi:RND family efflux transporter MFP subunit